MNEIRNVKIFKVGVHNQDRYTLQDLDDIVAASRELDFRPALKRGHTTEPGAPAYGWVKNLRRVGEKLYADFTDMHESVLNAIRNKMYRTVSAEIYFNLKRAGKVFPRALKAVALLGAEVPAVAGLQPLDEMQFAAAGDYERLSFAADDDAEPSANFDPVTHDAGAELDRRAQAYQLEHPSINYSDALRAACRLEPDLADQYRALRPYSPWTTSAGEDSK